MILNSAVILFVVLSLAATSGLFSERSGTVNIGINGMMLFGMISYYILSKSIHGTPADQLPLTLLAGVFGIIGGLLFGFIAITLKANQIIGGTAINLLAAAIGAFVLSKYGNDARALPDLSWALSTNTSEAKAVVSFSLIFGVSVLIIAFIALRFTPWGLRLRAAGENPQSLDSQGVSVIKMRYYGIIVSGFLAGIAGGVLMREIATYTGNVQGLGFVALAILIAGQWRFTFVVISAVIFSAIYSVAQNIDSINSAMSEIKPLIQTAPFVLSLVTLMLFSKNSNTPASAGVAYDKSKR